MASLKKLEADLQDLERVFAFNGGRGCETADEIDAHRVAVDILKGVDATCANCGEGLVPCPPTEAERVALADAALDRESESHCATCRDWVS